MSRSTESMWSSLFGIRLVRKTTTVSVLSRTLTRMSFLSASPSTLPTPLTTSRRSGSPRFFTSARVFPSSWSAARRIFATTRRPSRNFTRLPRSRLLPSRVRKSARRSVPTSTSSALPVPTMVSARSSSRPPVLPS
ncbi:hypothetical protein VTN02DRAFT_2373 [Thermoascus thermophilus]